jgi:hypothetical protein
VTDLIVDDGSGVAFGGLDNGAEEHFVDESLNGSEVPK